MMPTIHLDPNEDEQVTFTKAGVPNGVVDDYLRQTKSALECYANGDDAGYAREIEIADRMRTDALGEFGTWGRWAKAAREFVENNQALYALVNARIRRDDTKRLSLDGCHVRDHVPLFAADRELIDRDFGPNH
ncbi:MAG: hypothetical protein KGL39_17050 [Patescibacteria group bacterium]|nr:hypothetical protein [Patescibacteria group bacterium]